VNIGVATTFLRSNSVWKYLDNGSNQGTNWSASNFDDTAWAAGLAPLGYGDVNGLLFPLTTNSYGPNTSNKFVTTYYRQSFLATNLAAYTNLTMRYMRDDGIIVYLNGNEVARNYM